MQPVRLSMLARMIKGTVLWYFRRQKWTVVNSNPDLQKAVIIAAPHTSNWDFIFYLGGVTELALPQAFVGKKSLFRWPFGSALRDLGGIAVDRSRSTNFVESMIAEFAARDALMLTIAPEGTRGKVKKWKTGFYHIAMGANVPLVLGMMDYAKKQVGLAGAIWPTGDYAADMKKVLAFYKTTTPKHPHQGSVDFGTLD
jgi:1-acyl-sn-glycerol-3-phosphate acyltransferase